MRVIICGSRSLFPTLDVLNAAVEASGFDPSEVVCGCAEGVDQAGAAWAEAQGIPVKHFPANWKRFGRRAGPMRNTEMVAYAEGVIAVWDGESNGTRDTICKAREAGLQVYVHTDSLR